MDYYPSFYYTSLCLAGNCPDTCCAGWEIPLTEDDTDFLKTYRSDDLTAADILTVDDDGDACMRLKEGKCPFLNKGGLCRLRLEFSQERTPEVCRQHPLFIEEYDGFTENCPSLSCPAVCRDVFDASLKENIYPTPEYTGEDKLLSLLLQSRKMIFDAAKSDEADVNSLFGYMLTLSFAVNESYDDGVGSEILENVKSDETVKNLTKCFDAITDGLAEVLNNDCEKLGDEWSEAVAEAAKVPFSEVTAGADENDVLKFVSYLTYRYWLKGINSEDAVKYALFIIFSAKSCRHIANVTGLDFRGTARLFSKEIEHDTDNTNIITEYLCDAFDKIDL